MAATKTNNLDLDNPADWLRAAGSERSLALKRAADRLLEVYRCSPRIPRKAINLHRLSALQGAKVVFVKNLPGGGKLLPVPGGFQILISTDLPYRRFRAAVAHELAHSLFFSKNGDKVPARLFPPNKIEHQFCFDLVRHILAPEWLLEEAGVFDTESARTIFDTLTNRLGMSRPLAARLMLADYEFQTGVADRWVYKQTSWRLAKGHSIVSPSITGYLKKEQEARARLRSIALQAIRGEPIDHDGEVICLREREADGAFVLVTTRRHP